jgi:hypothetical protein
MSKRPDPKQRETFLAKCSVECLPLGRACYQYHVWHPDHATPVAFTFVVAAGEHATVIWTYTVTGWEGWGLTGLLHAKLNEDWAVLSTYGFSDQGRKCLSKRWTHDKVRGDWYRVNKKPKT